MKRTLLLMRHAKSSWEQPSLDDLERPLSSRGKKAAPLMGARIAALEYQWDAIITSPALRAKSTAVSVAEATGFRGKIIEDPRLYFEGVEGMREVIAGLDASLHCVMLFGHNPDMEACYEWLCKKKVTKFPTAACAIFETSDAWENFEGYREVWYDFPKSSGK